MATKGKLKTNEKRKRLIEKYAERRRELRAIVKNVESTPEQIDEAQRLLARLPRNSCANRYRNRCSVSGRPRAFYRKFGLSRIALRELAHRGEIPGCRKSSW